MTCLRPQVLPFMAAVFAVTGTALGVAQELPPGPGPTWRLAGAFLPHSEPGPLEQQARPATPENPIPRRTRLVRPPYPPEAAVVGARASVTLRVVVDHLGTVAEVRPVGPPVLGAVAPGSPADERAFSEGLLALSRSARDAVGQWLYEPPADAPIAFNVVIGFTTQGDGEVIAQSSSSWDALAPADQPDPGTGSPATKVKHVTPVYPAAAREAGVSGTVSLEVHVGTDGRVQDVKVVRSIPELDEAAVEAVRQWEYTPRRIDGDPTPVAMMVTVQFSLP